MAEMTKYRSTEKYTVEDVDVMGTPQKQVTNSIGMPVAILTEDSFKTLYEPIPAVETASEPASSDE